MLAPISTDIVLTKSELIFRTSALDLLRKRSCRFLLNLARCYYECGYLRQAERLLKTAYPTVEFAPAVVLALLGRIVVRLGKTAEGLELLEQAEQKQATLAGLHVEIARTYLSQRKPSQAKEAALREIALNPNSADAHGALARA